MFKYPTTNQWPFPWKFSIPNGQKGEIFQMPEDQKETLNIWAGWNLINYLLDYWLFQNKECGALKKNSFGIHREAA